VPFDDLGATSDFGIQPPRCVKPRADQPLPDFVSKVLVGPFCRKGTEQIVGPCDGVEVPLGKRDLLSKQSLFRRVVADAVVEDCEGREIVAPAEAVEGGFAGAAAHGRGGGGVVEEREEGGC
jgi:hypothetical protein